MLFIRTLEAPSGTPRTLAHVRALCIVALAAYPAGGLLRALGPDTVLTQLGGLTLIAASIICAFVAIRSRVSRITGEVSAELDEYERHLRAGALEASYAIVVGLTLLGIIYLALASDFGWWVPTGYDQWNAIFWGAFLTASLMPATVLAFRLSPEDAEGDRA